MTDHPDRALVRDDLCRTMGIELCRAVIDHVVPLKRRGAESLSNMQWQTKDETKREDKWE